MSCPDCSNTCERATQQAPDIQKQYSLPKRVAEIRTRVRQEFERHRYVNKLHIVDKLITKSHIDFQVRFVFVVMVFGREGGAPG